MPESPAARLAPFSKRRGRVPASFAVFYRFSFALCLFYHFPAASHKPITVNDLPPDNYSFKVVFRVFRDFHSVPVKPLICSDWNIRANVPAGDRWAWQACIASPTGTSNGVRSNLRLD